MCSRARGSASVTPVTTHTGSFAISPTTFPPDYYPHIEPRTRTQIRGPAPNIYRSKIYAISLAPEVIQKELRCRVCVPDYPRTPPLPSTPDHTEFTIITCIDQRAAHSRYRTVVACDSALLSAVGQNRPRQTGRAGASAQARKHYTSPPYSSSQSRAHRGPKILVSGSSSLHDSLSGAHLPREATIIYTENTAGPTLGYSEFPPYGI